MLVFEFMTCMWHCSQYYNMQQLTNSTCQSEVSCQQQKGCLQSSSHCFLYVTQTQCTAVVFTVADTHSNCCSRPFIVCSTGSAGQCSGCGCCSFGLQEPMPSWHHWNHILLALLCAVVTSWYSQLRSMSCNMTHACYCREGRGYRVDQDWIWCGCIITVWCRLGVHAGHNSYPVVPFILYTEL